VNGTLTAQLAATHEFGINGQTVLQRLLQPRRHPGHERPGARPDASTSLRTPHGTAAGVVSASSPHPVSIGTARPRRRARHGPTAQSIAFRRPRRPTTRRRLRRRRTCRLGNSVRVSARREPAPCSLRVPITAGGYVSRPPKPGGSRWNATPGRSGRSLVHRAPARSRYISPVSACRSLVPPRRPRRQPPPRRLLPRVSPAPVRVAHDPLVQPLGPCTSSPTRTATPLRAGDALPVRDESRPCVQPDAHPPPPAPTRHGASLMSTLSHRGAPPVDDVVAASTRPGHHPSPTDQGTGTTATYHHGGRRTAWSP